MAMKAMFLVERDISQVCNKTQALIVQIDVTDVYREYVNEVFQGFSIKQCRRIGLDRENALLFH